MPSRKKNANDLLRAAGKLKEVKRSGWINKAGMKNPESVADHSYRMALLGMLLGKEMGLDAAKVVRMCLLHDLAESVTGDLMPEEKKSKELHRKEELKVIESLIASLPTKLQKMLVSEVRELMAGNTAESKLAWEIDKLEMGLQARDYARNGHNLGKLASFDPGSKLSKPLRKILAEYIFPSRV